MIIDKFFFFLRRLDKKVIEKRIKINNIKYLYF